MEVLYKPKNVLNVPKAWLWTQRELFLSDLQSKFDNKERSFLFFLGSMRLLPATTVLYPWLVFLTFITVSYTHLTLPTTPYV